MNHKNKYSNNQCGICGSTKKVTIFSGPDYQTHLTGNFTIVKCSNCSVYYQYPRPSWSELEPHYKGEYNSYHRLLLEEKSPVQKFIKRLGPIKQRNIVEKFANGGNILDVGSGSGIFIEEISKSNRWNVNAIEPTTHMAEYTAAKLGIGIVNETWEETNIIPNSIDVLTMWNVFEHLDDPIFSISKIQNALRTNGIAIIAIPNYESISRILFGRYWVGWELPRHLYIFPSNLLRFIFEDHQFEVLDESCFLSSYATFYESLKFLMKAKNVHHNVEQAIHNIYFSLPIRLVLYPLFRLVELLNLSTIKTWVIRKK